MNQKVAIGILKKIGLSVEAVANGAEAVKALELIPYDLVLMDCQMPEMDGYEATKKIRSPISNVKNHDVPIIAMTAHAMTGDREKCLQAGMNDYISKPVDPQSLAKTIEKWLEKYYIKSNFNSNNNTDGKNMENTKIDEPADLFDKNVFMTNMMDDEELAKVITNSFIDDYPKQIEMLVESEKSKDYDTAERAAHTIKGVVATLGSEPIRLLAYEMEKAAAEKNLEFVAENISLLTSYLNMLEQKFKDLNY